jgi:hypothetical protein
MRLCVHPVGELLAGFILFPWSEAQPVLRGLAEILSTAPDELSVLAVLLLVGPIWTGKPAQGQELMTRLQSLGTPILTQVGPMRYTDLIDLFDAQVVKGRRYAVKTRWLADLTPDIISAVVAAGATRTSSLSMIALHHFHGQACRSTLMRLHSACAGNTS